MRPLHNYMAKEKIEKIYQIESKSEGNSPLLANNWRKVGGFNHFLLVIIVMQRSLF